MCINLCGILQKPRNFYRSADRVEYYSRWLLDVRIGPIRLQLRDPKEENTTVTQPKQSTQEVTETQQDHTPPTMNTGQDNMKQNGMNEQGYQGGGAAMNSYTNYKKTNSPRYIQQQQQQQQPPQQYQQHYATQGPGGPPGQQPTRQPYPKRNMSPAGVPPGGAGYQQWQPAGYQYRGSPRFSSPVNPAAYGSYNAQTYGAEYDRDTYNRQNMPSASSNSSNQSTGSNSMESLSKTNLYIRGLTPTTTDKDLVNLCQQYGKITSTKAIIDQATNKCKGYGFVDFESPQAADIAVKALQAQGVQAQMAKVGNQQEEDPTNLYIANLPMYMTEQDLENMFTPYGTVISTRILRDQSSNSRGVGFARMESKEKCDQIKQAFNSKILPGCKDALLVKNADGGNKKKTQYKQNPGWTDRGGEGIALAYDQSAAVQNGLYPYSLAQTMISPGMVPRYTVATTAAAGNYPVQTGGTSWMYHPQHVMQSAITPVIPTSLHPGSTMDPNLMPTLAAQMGQLQLSGASYMQAGPYHQMAYPATATTPILQQQIQYEDSTSAPGAPEEHHHYQYTQTASAK
ncbi:RNA-binding motif, single-stranded-interacting protein 2 isoform X3 [Lingula anatina]|uniref:RNA-binding motif, single-stranded-interacting protein 2 isoform X3 n=1 Tax=Lingula anatina TaxID=7574 RepID=A0A1S3IPH3_LINAN|nr:RNA-binding motif, single-stranded-interacting protein 2 isoform X3 [Lingula anatina]|eukprot:XP_013399973.1 RNA-binding motif, single-stranded-interacting protein 2 isoform X3 [Lingula anatina]